MSRVILLADDSVTIQKVIELTFMDEDYEVVAVSNGDDAIQKLKEGSPDFVIADVHMPGSTGYEVCREAKARQPEVPVLLLVGTFEPFDESEANAAGADSYLKKPFDSQELLRLVDELGGAGGEAGTGEAAAEADAPVGEDDPTDATAEVKVEEDVFEPEPEEPPVAAADAGSVWGNLDEPPVSEVTPPADLLEAGDEPQEAAEADGGEPFPLIASRADEPLPAADAPSDDAEEISASEEAAPAVEEAPEESAAPEPESEEAAPAEETEEVEAVATADANGSGLSDDDIDRIARKVVDLVGERLVREIAWEVLPDLAEVVVKERLAELESQVD